MIPISGCVISLNEEDRIERCLRSLGFCHEIILLDSGSSDRTRERAAELGARVEVHEFLGHVRQKQRAVDLARHDWVFAIDCDEIVTDELRNEIVSRFASQPQGVAGFRVPRDNVYLGKRMRHGLFRPDRKLRLFDRRCAAWGGTDPHDRVETDGPVLDLEGAIVHDSYRSFAEHRATVDRFARIAAHALRAQGRGARAWSPWTRGSAALCKGLLLKLGFLDGWRGFVAACMSARYDFLKYRRLRSMADR